MRSLNWSKTIKRIVLTLAVALALTATWPTVPATPPADPPAPTKLNNPVVPLVNWNS